MGSLGVNEDIVYDIKLSSVVPGHMTAENTVHELSNMDLVMKLHYLKGIYFFDKSAVEGITTADFKFPMFEWLELYNYTSGRIRKSESGRPFIKCNDGGVRIVEAMCRMTVEECLEENNFYVHNQLSRNQVLGSEVAFSPLVLIQFTWFKCGGMSVGLSWAHVLGDAFSASSFINLWGQIMAGKSPPKSLNFSKAHKKTANSEIPPSTATELLSVKKIEAAEDSWIVPNNCRMETFSFRLTATQLKHMQSKISDQSHTSQVPVFETLGAIIWHCLAKIRGESESRIITTCRNDFRKIDGEATGNNQIIGVVKVDFSVPKAEPSELAASILKQQVHETSVIEDNAAKEQDSAHFVVYGTNLTIVDLEDANLYGIEFKGQKPVFTNYSMDGVGEKGVALVLPGPEESDGRGRTLTLILPKNEVMALRNNLKDEYGLV
ncbi:hypothetical protein ACHQM5_016347 [Ranunculus cassubicifolius]